MAEEDFEDLLRRKTSDKILCVKLLVALWCSGYHYCTTSFNKAWILLQHRLKTSVSDICNYVNLWQWSWMEIRLNIFCQSTILQKQLIPKYFQFGIASNPLNHGYQHGFVSMVYDFFDKKTGNTATHRGAGIVSEDQELAHYISSLLENFSEVNYFHLIEIVFGVTSTNKQM